MTQTAYDTQILKALGKFKQIRNWPDLNSCLQGIVDTLQSFPDSPYVPNTLLFAKTLSQCLSPALPAGIQSKALDVYHKLFERMGENRIIRDFHIWAPGLFQFFHSAGVAQRLTALKLFNDFFVPLIPANMRIAPTLILAILPGYMDEGTDVQTVITGIFKQIQTSLGTKIFWRSMFRSALTHQFTRSPFLAYALHAQTADIATIDNDDLIIATMATLLNDQNSLVIRGALDLFLNCFSSFSKRVQSELAFKVIFHLSSDDQSLRRRVFNWISQYEQESIEALCQAPTLSIKVALEREGTVHEIVIKCLPVLLQRNDFEIEMISSLVNANDLLNSAAGNYPAIQRILQCTQPSTETKVELLNHILNKINENNGSLNVLCDIACQIIDVINNTHVEIATKASECIFEHYRNEKIPLNFITKLFNKIHLEPSFEKLITTPMPYNSIHTLISLSQCNLPALLQLDDNVTHCLDVCWTELSHHNFPDSEICKSILYLYHNYPSQFSIQLNQSWNNDSVAAFVNTSTELPIYVLIIGQKKARKDEKAGNVLRLIAGHAQLLLNDIKRNITKDDPDFSHVVISSVQKLLDNYARLFISSVTEGSLIEFVKFLLSNCGTTKLVNAFLIASESTSFLGSICSTICDYVLNNRKDQWAPRLIIPLAQYDLKIIDLIDACTFSPLLFNSIIKVCEEMHSSEQHYSYLEALSLKSIELLEIYPLEEPLLHDVSLLFKLIIQRSTVEIADARASIKASSIKRLLTAIEDLDADDCVASLTANFMPDYHAPYSSIAPRFLPRILKAICRDISDQSASNYIVPFFISFENEWRLLIYYSIAVIEDLQSPKIIQSLITLASDIQLLNNVKKLINVNSYDEKSDKILLCKFLESIIMMKIPVIDSPEAIATFTQMFQLMHFPPISVIHLIITYLQTFPEVTTQAFQAPFISALNEIKTSHDALISTLEYICTIDLSTILTLFNSKLIPIIITKTFSAIDKTKYQFPMFLSKFSTYDAEGFNYVEAILSILSECNFFSFGKEYVEYTKLALNEISNYDKFVPSFIDLLNSNSGVLGFKQTKNDKHVLKKLILLAFVLFACDVDMFANRLQNINALLVHTVNFDSVQADEFKVFSLFMRVLFIRFSPKYVESFWSIMTNELITGLSSDNKEIKEESQRLMRAAMLIVPGSFQFTEFAFLPDLLVFDENEPTDKHWPLLKDSKDSLLYVSTTKFDISNYEQDLISEFLS